jgi:DNA-binding response OmpR family regulator
VDAVADGEEALRAAHERRFDLVLSDVMMPRLDGFGLLRALRADPVTASLPVMLLSARAGEEAQVEGRSLGADDYVVKPFSGEHLAARIAALLRRAAPDSGAIPVVIAVAGLRIDQARREALLDGRPLELSRREFDLLAYLAGRPGTVVSRRELLTEVWHQAYGDDQTIDVHVSWLRRKLGETAAHPRYLQSVRGVGVRLVAPPDSADR